MPTALVDEKRSFLLIRFFVKSVKVLILRSALALLLIVLVKSAISESVIEAGLTSAKVEIIVSKGAFSPELLSHSVKILSIC
jgi:hypothetical protein